MRRNGPLVKRWFVDSILPQKWTGVPRFRGTPAFSMAVSRILSSPKLSLQTWTVICLDPALRPERLLRAATITRRFPQRFRVAERAGHPIPPVLSCTAWGFSCPLDCSRGGGLLPRLFTLTRRLLSGRFIFCDTFRRDRLSPIPPVRSTRHAALRCPDFPLGPASQQRPNDRPPSQETLYAFRG